jgi:hypothetical protein
MKAIIATCKTLIDTLRVVGQYRNYYLYPLLSFIIMLLVTSTGIIPLFEGVLGSDQNDVLSRVLFFLVVYLAYGVLYFLIAFCNVALLTGIAARLDGEDPGLVVGIVRASQRIRLIAVYTLVSATLGLLSVVDRVLVHPLFGMVIAPSIGKRVWLHWYQVSYSIPLLMAVPVIALDQPVPEQVFKRSARLVKQTWGEGVKPAQGIGLLQLLVLLPIIVLWAMPTLRQGAAAHNADLIRLGLSSMLVAISTYIQLSALVNAIFALAAYRYATVGNSDLFPGDPSYADRAFVKDKKATEQGDTLSHTRVYDMGTIPNAIPRPVARPKPATNKEIAAKATEQG